MPKLLQGLKNSCKVRQNATPKEYLAHKRISAFSTIGCSTWFIEGVFVIWKNKIYGIDGYMFFFAIMAGKLVAKLQLTSSSQKENSTRVITDIIIF